MPPVQVPETGGIESKSSSPSSWAPLKLSEKERRQGALKILQELLTSSVFQSRASSGESSHLIELLSHRSSDGLTPFMYAVSLRAYEAALQILDAALTLRSRLSSSVNKDLVFTNIIFPMDSRSDQSPLYVLCSNDTCSFTWTGDHHITQDIFECRTCTLVDNLCCCTECARTCHKGHDCKIKTSSPTAYCDCWEKCKCKSLIAGDQDKRFKLLERLLDETNLLTIATSRGEHLLIFLAQTVGRQIQEQRNYKRNCGSSSSSRRQNAHFSADSTSSGGGGGVGDMPQHDLEPPKFSRRALERICADWHSLRQLFAFNVSSLGSSEADPNTPNDESAFVDAQSGAVDVDKFIYTLLVKCPSELLAVLVDTVQRRLSNDQPNSSAAEDVAIVRRFVRSVARLFVILCIETAPSNLNLNLGTERKEAATLARSMSASVASSAASLKTALNSKLARIKSLNGLSSSVASLVTVSPIAKCEYVFRQFSVQSVEELADAAHALIAPVLLGATKPSTFKLNMNCQSNNAATSSSSSASTFSNDVSWNYHLAEELFNLEPPLHRQFSSAISTTLITAPAVPRHTEQTHISTVLNDEDSLAPTADQDSDNHSNSSHSEKSLKLKTKTAANSSSSSSGSSSDSSSEGNSNDTAITASSASTKRSTAALKHGRSGRRAPAPAPFETLFARDADDSSTSSGGGGLGRSRTEPTPLKLDSVSVHSSSSLAATIASTSIADSGAQIAATDAYFSEDDEDEEEEDEANSREDEISSNEEEEMEEDNEETNEESAEDELKSRRRLIGQSSSNHRTSLQSNSLPRRVSHFGFFLGQRRQIESSRSNEQPTTLAFALPERTSASNLVSSRPTSDHHISSQAATINAPQASSSAPTSNPAINGPLAADSALSSVSITNNTLGRLFSILLKLIRDLINDLCSTSEFDAKVGRGRKRRKRARRLVAKVNERMESCWQWLASLMDSCEAQLRFGAALSTSQMNELSTSATQYLRHLEERALLTNYFNNNQGQAQGQSSSSGYYNYYSANVVGGSGPFVSSRFGSGIDARRKLNIMQHQHQQFATLHLNQQFQHLGPSHSFYAPLIASSAPSISTAPLPPTQTSAQTSGFGGSARSNPATAASSSTQGATSQANDLGGPSSSLASQLLSAQTLSSRRDFMSYALSLMRAHTNEHRDSLPPVDISLLKHVAYVFDGLFFYMRREASGDAYQAESESSELSETEESGNKEFYVCSEEVSDEEEGKSGESDEDDMNLAFDDEENEEESEKEETNRSELNEESMSDVIMMPSNDETESDSNKQRVVKSPCFRDDAFFRRSESTLCLGGRAADPIRFTLDESLPLAAKPHLLLPHARVQDMFRVRSNLPSQFKSLKHIGLMTAGLRKHVPPLRGPQLFR